VADPFLNLRDNQIEIIVLSYLIKHPVFLDEYYDKLNDKIFYNPEYKKILSVLNEFFKKIQKILQLKHLRIIYQNYQRNS